MTRTLGGWDLKSLATEGRFGGSMVGNWRYDRWVDEMALKNHWSKLGEHVQAIANFWKRFLYE